jgi:hypothetical protein
MKGENLGWLDFRIEPKNYSLIKVRNQPLFLTLISNLVVFLKHTLETRTAAAEIYSL